VDAFVSGADVHKSTAIKLFGEESYDKEKRKMAKICNFSILYGATYQSLAERFDMSLSEAEEFHKRYKDALPTLFNWEARLHRRAKRDGTAYTYFGRPRRIKFYFENRQAGFGYRTITNTCIQGTASDLLKLAIRRLWSNLLGNPKYIPDCRFCLTVHDEIDYAVRYSKVNEVLPIIVDSMTISIPEWPVIITVEVSVGFSWGYVFAFEYDKNKERWTPILA
jgi:DNA polymerase-1